MCDLKQLNQHFEEHSYAVGFVPSTVDLEILAKHAEQPAAELPHLLRWWKHISSFSAEERAAFVKAECPCACKGKAEAEKKEEKKEEKKADDDDFDPFAEETEEEAAAVSEAKAKAEEEAKKKAAKKKEEAKSQIVLEVKPWDDETPLEKMEEEVRKITKNGLLWGQSKFVPIGYGIRKLQIVLVIVDELVSMDEIEEEIMALTDYVQSVDIASFNKL